MRSAAMLRFSSNIPGFILYVILRIHFLPIRTSFRSDRYPLSTLNNREYAQPSLVTFRNSQISL